jgi:hypothetical protein
MGGAISQIAAAFMAVQREKGTAAPALKIDCITFGAPNVGNREFTDYLNRNVNLRRIGYVGSGQMDIPEEEGLKYGFADIVTQVMHKRKAFSFTHMYPINLTDSLHIFFSSL